MSTNLNYKQVANVSRRTWDVETYDKKAKARQQATTEAQATTSSHASSHGGTDTKSRHTTDGEETKEEFFPAEAGAAGPEGSKRAFLKARRRKVDIDSKVGETEMVSAEAASTVRTAGEEGSSSGVVKTGVGWHCKVCDCFLKDSHTYLDHINGRKHQRKLGFSMRVERSTKEQVQNVLEQLTKKKEEADSGDAVEEQATNYDEMVKAKDEEESRRREERQRKRKERKKRLQQEQPEAEEDEEVAAEIDPAMAAMMGFSGFGGGNKNG